MEPSEIYLIMVLGACVGWQLNQLMKWLKLRSATVAATRRPRSDRF
jgi:hypothetical protein